MFASLTKQGYASAPKAILLPLTPHPLPHYSHPSILVSFMVLRVHLCYAVGESSIGRKADIPWFLCSLESFACGRGTPRPYLRGWASVSLKFLNHLDRI